MVSRDLLIFIGRGSCCYGHIISIDRKGNLKYLVGTYDRLGASDRKLPDLLPETFDPKLVEIDEKYGQKEQLISGDRMQELARLMQSDKQLRFEDKVLVFDDYLYQVFLDQKRVAYGYGSNMKNFPTELKELINLVTGAVELHKLPGTA